METVSAAQDALGAAYRRFAGRRVLVTGHTGFKGSWLTLWLAELGADVTGYALPPQGPQAHFDELGLSDRIRHRLGDVRDLEALRKVVREAEPEVVFHLAAQALVRRSYADPLETFTTNVTGGANLLETVRGTASVKALVFVTSDKCYENKEWVWGYRETDELGGKDPYSASKAAVELVFKAYQSSYFAGREGFGAATARAGNVIGGGDWSADRIVPDCIRALAADQPIVLRNPTATRPWQFVLEPLSGYLDLALALLDDPKGFSGAWNFGPAGLRFPDVAEVAAQVVANWGGGSIRTDIDPNAAHEAGLLHLSIDKALARLGWRPTYASHDAVRATTEWYRRRQDGASVAQLSLQQIRDFVAAGRRND